MNNYDKLLKLKAAEIVDKLMPKWPWEETHLASIEYVYRILKSISTKEKSK